MKKITLFSLFLSSLLLLSCKDSKTKKTSTLPTTPQNFKVDIAQGFQLLETNCFSCHSPNPEKETGAAPSMAEVKKQYLKTNTTEQQFTEEVINFLNNPNLEKAKIPKAVEKFGLMPKMGFSAAPLRNIVAYLYASELEQPNWYEEKYPLDKEKYKKGAANKTTPIQKGKKIAMQTKTVLGKNLLGAISKQGTEHALSFCSTKAIHLTDSMSTTLATKIKRVSDKNRNPKNAANQEELKYINDSKKIILEHKKPQPKLIEKENTTIGYYPIMTNNMCLQCHGEKNTDINPQTLSKIEVLYPNDKAFGYKSNELRGIWVIEMKK